MASRRNLIILGAALLIASCGSGKNEQTMKKEAAMTTDSTSGLVLASGAFKKGEAIPKQYGCKGADISPPLEWSNIPNNTKTLALIVDDPDAPMGTWVHWVIFNIPSTATGLPENVPPEESLPDGALQGKNDFRNYGYGGPCPPGGTHRYFFKLYALDATLQLKGGCTKAELLKAMRGHVIGEAQLMGRYSR
jgi:Raf kinase inhibitor-like YbhB/YbcL family protein